MVWKCQRGLGGCEGRCSGIKEDIDVVGIGYGEWHGRM